MSDNLDREEYFNMADDGKLIAKVALGWKKSFSMGVEIPHKVSKCGDCKKDSPCDSCDQLVNQTDEFSASLNEIKRQHPNDFRSMIPWYKTT